MNGLRPWLIAIAALLAAIAWLLWRLLFIAAAAPDAGALAILFG